MQRLAEARSLSDPFASDSDDDELEENEVCIDNDVVMAEELDHSLGDDDDDDDIDCGETLNINKFNVRVVSLVF
jgi:hypothetical protein